MHRATGKLLWLLLVLALGVTDARAGGASYTLSYGGRLTDAQGQPVAGPVKLTVDFYRAATGGEPLLAGPLTFDGTVLTNGVFQVALALDAGEFQTVFSDVAEPVFVEVTDATHGKRYPRQRFSLVPYAGKVPVDGKTVAFDGNGVLTVGPQAAPGANQFLTKDAGGNLVWGTPSTNATQIAGAAVATGTPSAGTVLKYVGGQWKAVADTGVNRGGDTMSGFLGIGTTSAQTALDVTGVLTQRAGGAPALAPAGEGRIYFDASSNQFMVSQNGGAYAPLGTVTGGVITQVSAGGGLTGGGTTGNVTVAMPSVGTAGTYTRVLTDAYGRVTAGTSLTAADLPPLPVTQIVGTLAAAQVAAIPVTQLAGTLAATQLPSVPVTQLAGTLTTAQLPAVPVTQLSGTLTTAQLPAVPVTQLSGTLTTAQLPSIPATQVSGTLAAAQLPGIPMNQLTGTLTTAQLPAIPTSQLSGTLTTAQLPAIPTSQLSGTLTTAQLPAIPMSQLSGTLTTAQLPAIPMTQLSGTLASAQLPAVPQLSGLSLASPGVGSLLKTGAGGTLVAAGAADLTSLVGTAYVSRAGDTMTGALGLPADGLSVGGSELVTSGGAVGVGTSSPGALLDVIQAAAAKKALSVTGPNGASASTVAVTGGTTGTTPLVLLHQNIVAGNTGPTLQLDGPGSGGGSNPALYVNGTSATGPLAQFIRGNIDVPANGTLSNGDTVQIRDATDGASAGLRIYSRTVAGETGPLLVLNQGHTAAAQKAESITLGSATAVGLDLTAAASATGNLVQVTSNGGTAGNLFVVSGAGSVGIGSASPTAALDVAGTVRAQSFVSTSGASNFSGQMVDNVSSLSIGTTAAGTDLFFGAGTSRTISVQSQAAAGNSLTIQAGGTSGANQNGGNLVLASGTANGTGSSQIQLQTANGGAPVTAMTVFGSGNVGIGTSSASARLEVQSGADTQVSLQIDPSSASQTAAGLLLSRLGTAASKNSLPLQLQISKSDGTPSYVQVQNVQASGNFDQSTLRISTPSYTVADFSTQQTGATYSRFDLYNANGTGGTYAFRFAGKGSSGSTITTDNSILELGVNGTDGNVLSTTLSGTSVLGVNAFLPFDAGVLKVRQGRSSGANALEVDNSSGSPLTVVDYNGNVGVGTTSAVYPLDVNGTVNATTMRTNNGVAQRVVCIRTYSVNTATPAVLVDCSGNPLALDKQYKLNAWISGTTTKTGAEAIVSSDGTNYFLTKTYEQSLLSNSIQLYLNGGIPSVNLYNHPGLYSVSVLTEELTATGANRGVPWPSAIYSNGAGYVGIGTTSPQGTLHLAGTSVNWVDRAGTASQGAGFAFRKSNGTIAAPTAVVNGDQIGKLLMYPYDGTSYFNTAHIAGVVSGTIAAGSVPTDLQFSTGTTGPVEAMRITAAGNVGIGTTTPTGRLHVVNPGSFTMLSIGDHTAGHTWGYLTTSADTGGYLALQSIQSQGSTNGNLALNPYGGNVGIGTSTPMAKLQIAGTAGTDGLMYPDGTLQTTAWGGTFATVYRSTSLSLASAGTWYDVPMDKEQSKANVTHSNTTNPERLTAATTGVYLVTYSVSFYNNGSTSGGTCSTRLLKNGTTEIAGTYGTVGLTTTNYSGVSSYTSIVALTAGDYVTVQAGANVTSFLVSGYNTSPGPTTTSVAALSMVKLQ